MSDIDNRLKEIHEKVNNEELTLDESLDLYEEAVNLGVKASQQVEKNVLENVNDEE